MGRRAFTRWHGQRGALQPAERRGGGGGGGVAGEGSLWVSEPLNQRVRRIHAPGTVTTAFDASTFEPHTIAGGKTLTTDLGMVRAGF